MRLWVTLTSYFQLGVCQCQSQNLSPGSQGFLSPPSPFVLAPGAGPGTWQCLVNIGGVKGRPQRRSCSDLHMLGRILTGSLEGGGLLPRTVMGGKVRERSTLGLKLQLRRASLGVKDSVPGVGNSGCVQDPGGEGDQSTPDLTGQGELYPESEGPTFLSTHSAAMQTGRLGVGANEQLCRAAALGAMG